MGEIICRASAGTLESSDVFVSLEPCEDGLHVSVESVVKAQFGESILASVEEVLKKMNITRGRVSIVDRGALDCVLRARVETAVMRGKGE